MINNTINSRYCERRSAIPFFSLYQLGLKIGKRVNHRRTAKGKPAYVDIYSGHLVLCIISIMLLSTLDAIFTLNILANGGEELNIFMAVLIEDNITKFIAFKLALTALALLLLTIHHNAVIAWGFRVSHLAYLVLAGYSALIAYELTLLSIIY
jgi:hypothetical protein